MRRRLEVLVLLCILAVTAATFSPVLENGFVSWDDDVYVTENPLIREISPDGFREIFSSFVSGNYHPLVFVSYAWEHRFFGLDPAPYHLTNLMLHLVNTALIFRLLLLLSGALPAAAAGTLLFALHPMRVEAVAWVTARKDLLSTAFFLGGIIAYLSWRERGGKGRYGASLLLFLLSLLSKATAAIFPLVLLLCDFLKGKVDRRAIVEKAPFFALALIFGIVAFFARESYQEVLLEHSDSLSDVIFIGAHKLALYYLAELFLPWTGIVPLYPTLDPGGNLLSPHVLLLLAIIGTLSALVAFSLRFTRKVAFGALFFLVTLLPSLTVVVVGYSADRFAYLPSVGAAYLAGELFLRLWSGRRGGTPAGRVCLLLLLVTASTALALSSREKCGIWRDSVTLWTDAVESYPDTPESSVNRAYAFHYRGLAYQEEGETERALDDLSRAIELHSGKAEFFTRRGQLYAKFGNSGEALADFTRALQVDPRSVEAYNERGILYTGAGDYPRAVSDFTRALEINPESTMVHLNLAILLLEGAEYEEAAGHFGRVILLDPSSAAAHYGRARSLFWLKEYRRAWEDLRRSEELGYPVDEPLRRELMEKAGTAPRSP